MFLCDYVVQGFKLAQNFLSTIIADLLKFKTAKYKT